MIFYLVAGFIVITIVVFPPRRSRFSLREFLVCAAVIGLFAGWWGRQFVRSPGFIEARRARAIKNAEIVPDHWLLVEWRSDSTKNTRNRKRYGLGLRIHTCRDLIGMSREDVLEVLGKQDYTQHKNMQIIVYQLGPYPGPVERFASLWVHFDKNDCVSRTSFQ